MDIILSFLAKSVDKHSITLVHITYPPLSFYSTYLYGSPTPYKSCKDKHKIKFSINLSSAVRVIRGHVDVLDPDPSPSVL